MRRLSAHARAIPLFRRAHAQKRAASYTISALIITVSTIALVLAAYFYAYQVLERQRGMSEFEIAEKSIVAFNDGLENVAWKLGAVRSTRFSVQYGYVQLIPNKNDISIGVIVDGSFKELPNSTFSTGIISYWLSTNYVTFGGPNYESYILGNSSSVISGSAETMGRSAIRQQTGWVNITLDYRVRVMRTTMIKVNGVDTNYVDIWVIKLSMTTPNAWSYIHDFDLQASTKNVRTQSYRFNVTKTDQTSVSVRIGSAPPQQVPITPIVPGQVVFNVVVAEVQVTA